MTQVCRVCSHPDRKKIDREILSSGNLSQIARKYKLGYDSVWRHKNTHVGGAAAAGVRKANQNHGVRLLEDLDDLVITARRILREAEADGHRVTALKALKECRASLVSIAQVSHAIWEQQNKEQQTIIIQEQQKEEKDWIREGLKVLTPVEYTEYRRLNVKLLAAQGGNYSNEEEPPDPSVDPEYQPEEISDKYPLVQGKNEVSDLDQNPHQGMEINPITGEWVNYKGRDTDGEPPAMVRTTPRG